MSVSIADTVQCLTEGGVVLIPTDTVLGLAASPAHPAAIKRLYQLKDRPSEKNIAVMVANHTQVLEIGARVDGIAEKLLQSDLVPGALTIVFALSAETPEWLTGRTEIAVRLPNDQRLLEILTFAGPLLVTSANLSGQDTPEDARDAAQQLTALPDLVIDGKGQTALPSTIINCAVTPPRLEREGAISRAAIEAIVGDLQ